MRTYNIAVIGAGGRARGLYNAALKNRKNVEIVAVCDPYTDKCEILADKIVENGGKRPAVYSDYKACIDETKPNVVLVATSWDAHIPVSMYAMEKGITVACEVGGAYSLQSLWDLVRCYERTKTPIMMMENCCFGRMELLALHMKRLGLLGEIVHASGAYGHDLRNEIATGKEKRHYRLEQYKHRNCDNYPTHEIGPIAKLLDINCGNRFTTLYAVSSKAAGMKHYVADRDLQKLRDVTFRQGDVVTSVLTCAGGETVTIRLDTTLPRFYSRQFTCQGTKGMISEEANAVILDEPNLPHIERKDCADNIDEYYKKYDHPIWKNYNPDKEGHGGIDKLEFDAFFAALDKNAPMPIDVYDFATWASISVLSEQSIATGNAVAFPDFTEGMWIHRKNEFALGKIE